jgi:hypothetical protein
VRIPGERAVVVPDQQVYRWRVTAVPDVQDHVLGERVRPVGVASRPRQPEHILHIGGGEAVDPRHRGLH